MSAYLPISRSRYQERLQERAVSKALDYVLGYVTSNDMTARTVQIRGSQWGYSKGFDQFAPIGPTIVSAESIPDLSVL
jgi:2-keto-4-pentenoate hydratase/2-oxohepta-3-ene-1,7-dioic acid hydratase in catechol pathway